MSKMDMVLIPFNIHFLNECVSKSMDKLIFIVNIQCYLLDVIQHFLLKGNIQVDFILSSIFFQMHSVRQITHF